MIGTLGGGGGMDGFSRLAKHIFPVSKLWLEDMREHAFDFKPENVSILDASVRKMLENYDMDQYDQVRPAMLAQVFKVKEAMDEKTIKK
jgi:3-hydroxyacyl-CoA dehydrogenase